MKESWSGPCKVTKADGTVVYQDPLSPAQVDRMAAAEAREAAKGTPVDKGGVNRILKEEPRSELGRRLDAAATRRGT